MTPVDPHFLSGGSDDHQGETPCPSCGYDLRGLHVGCDLPRVRDRTGSGGRRTSHSNTTDPRQKTSSSEATSRRIGHPGRLEQPERHRCASCGYDLKGLGSIGRCPECGLDYDTKRERAAAASRLLPPPVAASPRWRLGLLLLFVAASCYIGFLLVGLFPASFPIYELGTLLSLAAWSVGCWLAFPDTLDAGSPTWKWFRISACAAQALWIPAYLLSWVAIVVRGSRVGPWSPAHLPGRPVEFLRPARAGHDPGADESDLRVTCTCAIPLDCLAT